MVGAREERAQHRVCFFRSMPACCSIERFFYFQKNRVNQFLLFHFFTFPLLPSPLNCPASFDSDAISSMLPPLERHQHRGGEQQRPRKQQQQLFHRLFFSFY